MDESGPGRDGRGRSAHQGDLPSDDCVDPDVAVGAGVTGDVVEHPAWCDKARCTAALDTTQGEHRSVPVAVPVRPPEIRVHVGLTQALDVDSPPVVELYIGGRYQGYLLPRNARTLGRILADLGRAGLR